MGYKSRPFHQTGADKWSAERWANLWRDDALELEPNQAPGDLPAVRGCSEESILGEAERTVRLGDRPESAGGAAALLGEGVADEGEDPIICLTRSQADWMIEQWGELPPNYKVYE